MSEPTNVPDPWVPTLAFLTALDNHRLQQAERPSIDGPFIVDAVVEQHPDGTDSHHVRVELTPVAWRHLVGDVARAMFLAMQGGAPILPTLAAAGRPDNDLDREDALTRLVQRLGLEGQGVPSWLLTIEQVDQLRIALEDADDDPTQCYSCGRWIEQPSELTALTGCGKCAARQNGENP